MAFITVNTPKGIRKIGSDYPPFVVAEMSGNHLQHFEKACRIIDAACESGVDAVKLQTYTADTLTIDCDNEFFQVKVNETWQGKTLYALYQSAYTPWEWQPKLKEYAESKGLLFFSTPFDETAVDFLESLDVQLYKVASFSTLHIPLLEKIGSTKKPVIISRGLTSLEDLNLAVQTLKRAGAKEVAILHCVSSYPATPSQMNLRCIPDLERKFSTPVGLSDHTLTLSVPIAAAALGACVIEKHLTLDRKEGGPDACFSLEPKEMKELVKAVGEAYLALGKAVYDAGEKEAESLIFQQSIFAVRDIQAGELLTRENIRIIRPGNGLKPKHFHEVIGKRAKKGLKKGTPLQWEHID